MIKGKKAQGLPLNTIIIAIIVIVVLVVIILILTGQMAAFLNTLRGGGDVTTMCNEQPDHFCSYTGGCGENAEPNDAHSCALGGICCELS